MPRAALLLTLTACDAAFPIERVALGSECEADIDRVEALIDGRALCARATLHADPVRPDGSEAIITPGSFHLIVTASFQAGDATSYFLVVGVGPQTRRVQTEPRVAMIKPIRIRGPEKRAFYDEDAAIANLDAELPLDFNFEREWISPKSGFVRFDDYDVETGTSAGSFVLLFEATQSMVDVKRPIRVSGTFATSTPLVEELTSSADTR